MHLILHDIKRIKVDHLKEKCSRNRYQKKYSEELLLRVSSFFEIGTGWGSGEVGCWWKGPPTGKNSRAFYHEFQEAPWGLTRG